MGVFRGRNGQVDEPQDTAPRVDRRHQRERGKVVPERGRGRVRIHAARGAAGGLGQVGVDGRDGGQRAPVDLDQIVRVAVAGLGHRLLPGGDGAAGGAAQHQREHRRQLRLGQGQARVKPGDDVDDHGQRVVRVVPGQRGRRDRGLGHQVAAGHVAEVDQAARHQPAVAVAAADHVEVGHVAVDHLHPQIGGQALQGAVVHLHRALHQLAAGGVVHVADEAVNDRPCVFQVPLQHAVGGGMIEAVKRQGRLGGDRTQIRAGLRVEVAGLGHRLAVHPAGHAHVVGLAVPVDRHDLAALKGRDRQRAWQTAGRPPRRGAWPRSASPASRGRSAGSRSSAPSGRRLRR